MSSSGFEVADEADVTDTRALVAIDLGAQSCRVSLLRWVGGEPVISLVHRFANAPRVAQGGLRWDLERIEQGLMHGLRRCAERAPEGIRSVAVDGWAVDYVRADGNGRAVADPFCYRDERTVRAETLLHSRCAPERMRELTGVELSRINTLYQLYADELAGGDATKHRWLNLPEYILLRLGARPVAELTNASHTQMVDLTTRDWSDEIFAAAGIDPELRPELVTAGTVVGQVQGELRELSAFRETMLIAPACHDTASAIAGIPAHGEDWAYISSGTWSLVGTTLSEPRNGPEVRLENFTNLGAVGGRFLFHKSVNGMWLLQQCIEFWSEHGVEWLVPDLVAAAEQLPRPTDLIDVDEPDLMLPGRMPQRINAQLQRLGVGTLNEDGRNGPAFASLILHSQVARYAEVLKRIAIHSGKHLKRLFVVGGGSRNLFLNQLTAEATGLEVHAGSPESSTIGNFAVQLACLEGGARDQAALAEATSGWAARLQVEVQTSETEL